MVTIVRSLRSTSGTNSSGSTVAKALHSFIAENSNELSITAGDELIQWNEQRDNVILNRGRERGGRLIV